MSVGAATLLVGDWGTTSLRLWRVAPDGAAIAEVQAPEGLTTVRDGSFEAVLERHLAALDAAEGEPVVLCGMVGARTGWIEAPYLAAPLPLAALSAGAIQAPSRSRPVFVLPGVAQRETAAPDVMRGEETQLLGLASLAEGGGHGLVCMPGTHSKWVRLEGGRLAGFSTAMTGEVFALLRRGSVLSGAVEGAQGIDPEGEAFAGGVLDGFRRPAELTARLFGVRAAYLLHDRAAGEGLSRLSGLLIGAEIAGAASRWGDLSGTRLVATGPLAAAYGAALRLAGVAGVVPVDADRCGRAGLVEAARRLSADSRGAAA